MSEIAMMPVLFLLLYSVPNLPALSLCMWLRAACSRSMPEGCCHLLCMRDPAGFLACRPELSACGLCFETNVRRACMERVHVHRERERGLLPCAPSCSLMLPHAHLSSLLLPCAPLCSLPRAPLSSLVLPCAPTHWRARHPSLLKRQSQFAAHSVHALYTPR